MEMLGELEREKEREFKGLNGKEINRMDYGIRQGRKEIWRRDLGFCAVQEPPKLPLMPSSLPFSLSPPCVCVFSVFLSLLFFFLRRSYCV